MYISLSKEDITIIDEGKIYFYEFPGGEIKVLQSTPIENVEIITPKIARMLFNKIIEEVEYTTYSIKDVGEIFKATIPLILLTDKCPKDWEICFSVEVPVEGPHIFKVEKTKKKFKVKKLYKVLAILGLIAQNGKESGDLIYISESYEFFHAGTKIFMKHPFRENKPKVVHTAPQCHSGNIEIFPNLFAGGLSRGVSTSGMDLIIPLVENYSEKVLEIKYNGKNHKLKQLVKNTAPNQEIFHFPIKDFDVPKYKNFDWEKFAKILWEDYLSKGKKVVVFCQGGHGRTGIVISILLYFLWKIVPEEMKDYNGEEPIIKYSRKKYCERIVENSAQIKYIEDITGQEQKGVKASKSFVTATANNIVTYSGYGSYGGYGEWK